MWVGNPAAVDQAGKGFLQFGGSGRFADFARFFQAQLVLYTSSQPECKADLRPV